MKNIDHFPTSTGVYIMKDCRGNILYIGKAKNLRSRIKQYFSPSGDNRVIIPFLVKKIANIETIILPSEKEALLLENNLIKKHKPYYNALLKDDKGYIYITITKDDWPTLSIVNHKEKKVNDRLFGPYISKKSANKTLQLIHRLFQLRKCSVRYMKSRKRPCILHQMNKCLAPCSPHCSKKDYCYQIKLVTKFLRGQNSELLKDLNCKMQEESKKLNFEKAQKLLNLIRHLEQVTKRQKIDLLTNKNIDVIAIFNEDKKCILSKLIFQKGILVDVIYEKIDNKGLQNESELIRLFLMQHYAIHDIPCEIIIPLNIEDQKTIEEILSEKTKKKIKISTPKRGKKLDLIKIAQANAKKEFYQNEKQDKKDLLLATQKKLLLNSIPKRIECFDTSHHAGESFVAAMTTFIDGNAAKQFYRKYNIKTSSKDDCRAMQEVLTRRYKNKNLTLPDLIIIDGGKSQLNVAKNVMKQLNLNVEVISIAKEKSRHDKGLTKEKIYTKNSIVQLSKTSPILFLLQNIRDETHRFAITFHRYKFRKSRQKTK